MPDRDGVARLEAVDRVLKLRRDDEKAKQQQSQYRR
jgi:hypothetical protein